MNYEPYVNQYLEDFKSQCEQMRFDRYEIKLNSPICSISTDEDNTYRYLMDYFDKSAYKMLIEIIRVLLKEKKLKFSEINISSVTDKYYILGNIRDVYKRYLPEIHDPTNELIIYAKSPISRIYIFKNYGFQNLPRNYELVEDLKILTKAKYITYVNFDDEKDKNSNQNDLITLKDFFDEYLDNEEYEVFLNCINNFKIKAKEYLNFKVIRTLENSNLYTYKKMIEKNILEFNYLGYLANIESCQHKIIKESYIDNHLYECLLGKADFAKSFMTAEWLYLSMKNAKLIDLTTVVLGYFKSIEQFLGAYVGSFVDKIDSKTNKLFVFHPYGYGKENIELTRKNYDADKCDLAKLTSFFGVWKKDKSKPTIRNQSRMRSNISDETISQFVKYISQIPPKRNECLHKENIDDWKKVDEARSLAYCTFYLILGCQKNVDEFETKFDIIKKDESSKYKLCEFIYNAEPEIDVFPIFKIDDKLYFAHKQDNKNFNEYGMPVYKGVSFSPVDSPCKNIFYDINKLPNRIQVGYAKLKLNSETGLYLEPPTEYITIYESGVYIDKKTRKYVFQCYL